MYSDETIYKYDQSGNLRAWQAEISTCGMKYRTLSGIVGGAVVESSWKQVHGNNQRPNPVEQCNFEVNALYEHRLARTYHLTPEAAKAGAHFFEPMLAQPLDRKRLWFLLDEDAVGGEALLYVQPKLDGLRCITTADGMFTRGGKEIVSAPHINKALQPYFEKYPDAILDGELYGDTLAEDFNRLSGLARKGLNGKNPPTEADLRLSARLLQYHLYDMPSLKDGTIYERMEAVTEVALFVSGMMPFSNPSPLRIVETVGIRSWAAWDALHLAWRAQKYEGSIGRMPDAPYQQKRTHDLIKRKDFDAAEFDVSAVGEGEGNWAGACKQIYCWLPIVPVHERTPERVKDPAYTFKATPTGTYEYLRNVLEGETPVKTTVEYMGWSSTAIPKPRHPIAKALYWGDRDD